MHQSSGDLFPPEIQERADELLSLGYLTSDVEFLGDTYGLRTLNGEEELLASTVAKPYLESFGQLKAWAWANVGLALTHVNGDPDFCPPTGPDLHGFAHQRFRYATKTWFWPIGEFLFEEFKKLESERDAIIEAMRGLSERSPQNSWPSRDSSTGPADSTTTPEIMGLVED